MNAAQAATVQNLTNSLDRYNRYSDFSARNGVMVFSVEEKNDAIFLIASNEEINQHEKNLFLMAQIGPRGGVKVYANENVPAYIIK
jgi:hypothetical protein